MKTKSQSASHVPGKNFFLRKENVDKFVDKTLVKDVISTCHQFCSIYPAPERWEHGNLEVEENRCWRNALPDEKEFNYHWLRSEQIYHLARDSKKSAKECIKVLTSVFLEFRSWKELLSDNFLSFQCADFEVSFPDRICTQDFAALIVTMVTESTSLSIEFGTALLERNCERNGSGLVVEVNYVNRHIPDVGKVSAAAGISVTHWH